MSLKIKWFFLSLGIVTWLSVGVMAGSLAAPELDVPKDKAKNQVLTTLLKWKPVQGAKGYRVFVASSAEILNAVAPGSPCADCFIDEKTDGPSYQIPAKRLKKDIPYFWTVRAVSDTEEGPNAAVRSYTMASTFFMDMD
jgi:hypothetical protein